MSNSIMLFPTLNENLMSKIRFQEKKFKFFYTGKDEEEHELIDEPSEAMSSVNFIKDEAGVWTQNDFNLGFRRKMCLRTFQCLFGENGIACEDASLGLAIIWTSSDSKQRGVIPVGVFSKKDQILDVEAEKEFEVAQLRGEIELITVIYLAKPGNPKREELHLANNSGYILGELDKYYLKLDGSGSAFPIFEVSEPNQPLWYVKCDWIDPTEDLFEDSVSINLNKAHKNYKYIDRSQKTFVGPMLAEIMAAAVGMIVEKARLQSTYWNQILSNESLDDGSVGQAIFYFADTLEWDMSTPESVSLSARKYFDKRMKAL